MRVTSKGLATIPVEIREKVGFEPESEVEFEVVGNVVQIRKATSTPTRGQWVVVHAGTEDVRAALGVKRVVRDQHQCVRTGQPRDQQPRDGEAGLVQIPGRPAEQPVERGPRFWPTNPAASTVLDTVPLPIASARPQSTAMKFSKAMRHLKLARSG